MHNSFCHILQLWLITINNYFIYSYTSNVVKLLLFDFYCLIKFAHGLVMLWDLIYWSCVRVKKGLFFRLKKKKKKKNSLFVICDNVIVFCVFTVFPNLRASLADTREYFLSFYFNLIQARHVHTLGWHPGRGILKTFLESITHLLDYLMYQLSRQPYLQNFIYSQNFGFIWSQKSTCSLTYRIA